MDTRALLGGAVVAAATVTAAVVTAATPEAVGAALLLAGALTGAASRTYQSEFLDAFLAGTVGFAGAIVVLAVGFRGVGVANAIIGSGYNFGLLVYLAGVAASPLAGLVAAVGGSLGARARYAVADRADRT